MGAAAGLDGNFEIHLRGDHGTYNAWLERLVPKEVRSRVFLHAPVSAEELPVRIAEHDIGFAGELSEIPSRDLTATNKIFQYLQGGLAVVASDTAGQREVAALCPAGVFVYRGGSRASLADLLVPLIAQPDLVKTAKSSAYASAGDLTWNSEKPRLVAAVGRALHRPQASGDMS